MPLNLEDRIAVRRVIVNRCTAAVAKYALYVLGSAQATTPQLAWAREAMRAPASVGDAVSWHVIDQPAFIADGSGITDEVLGAAIETAINTRFIAAE